MVQNYFAILRVYRCVLQKHQQPNFNVLVKKENKTMSIFTQMSFQNANLSTSS